MTRPGQWVTRRHSGVRLAALLLLVLATVAPPRARATVRYGDIELSGSFDTQNLIRTSRPDQWQFIQNRNTMLLRMDWKLIKNGTLIDRYEFPFLRNGKLFLLYRGVYDGFYGLGPGDRQKGVSRADDIIGGPIQGNNAGTCVDPATGQRLAPCPVEGPTELRAGLYSRFNRQNRDAVAFENILREAYLDLSLSQAPLSFRIGRQQIIWGESDQFRMMDIVNPLDLSWHLQQEPFERLRVPQWIFKGLWDMGVLDAPIIGPLSNMFFETFWNPFDYYPGVKVGFLPQPWGAPIPNPVRSGQILYDTATGALSSSVFNLNGTSFRIGDFHKNPAEASSTGARFHAIMDNGLEFTINYVYARGRTIGALAGAPFALKIKSVTANLASTDPELGLFDNQGVSRADVNAEFVHPYSNIFGFTSNYSDEDYTQTVFRLETAYALNQPVQTVAENKRVLVQGPGVPAGLRAPIGYDTRDVWAGMLGFDRPTWIRFLNPRTTWFITGQFFWSYIPSHVSALRGPIITGAKAPYFTPPGTGFPSNPSLNASGGFGVWTNGPNAGLEERTQASNSKTSFNRCLDPAQCPLGSDNIRQWESLITLAAFTFYKGGSVMPMGAMAFDPVNINWLAQLSLDYFYTPNFILQAQAKYYTDFDRGLSLDPWGVGGLNHRRSEFGGKITFQF